MPIGIDSTGIDSTVSSFRYNMVVHDNSLWFYCRCLRKVANRNILKVIVVGDPGVGKTSFIHRFTSNTFYEEYQGRTKVDFSTTFPLASSLPAGTVGVDFSTALLDLPGGTRVRLQLWDIAGQERFTWMTRVYYREVMFRPNRAIGLS